MQNIDGDMENKRIRDFKDENIIKGEKFEDYVAECLFSKQHFKIVNRTPSAYDPNSTKWEVIPPDITLKELRSGEIFHVECKFRSNIRYNGSIEWTDFIHKKTYEKYGLKTGKKVYIALGVGKDPENPERLFLMDLSQTPYTTLYMTFYEEYEIPTRCTIKRISEIPYYS